MEGKRKRTQREKVVDHIREFGYIDRMSALNDCGIFELSARVVELEADGWRFDRQSKKVRVRDGSEVTVTEYRLADCNADDFEEYKAPESLED